MNLLCRSETFLFTVYVYLCYSTLIPRGKSALLTNLNYLGKVPVLRSLSRAMEGVWETTGIVILADTGLESYRPGQYIYLYLSAWSEAVFSVSIFVLLPKQVDFWSTYPKSVCTFTYTNGFIYEEGGRVGIPLSCQANYVSAATFLAKCPFYPPCSQFFCKLYNT